MSSIGPIGGPGDPNIPEGNIGSKRPPLNEEAIPHDKLQTVKSLRNNVTNEALARILLNPSDSRRNAIQFLPQEVLDAIIAILPKIVEQRDQSVLDKLHKNDQVVLNILGSAGANIRQQLGWDKPSEQPKKKKKKRTNEGEDGEDGEDGINLEA